MNWWQEQNGFFGEFYLKADTLRRGSCSDKEIRLRTKREVDGVEYYINDKKIRKILDCPCGYGRHSIELAKRGYEVTGIDINSIHLELAKKNTESTSVEFIEMNMLDIDYKNKFDLIINLFASFGFFESEATDFLLLRKLYNSLVDDGVLIMHIDIDLSSINNEKNSHQNTITLSNGDILQIHDRYDPLTKRINGEWSIIDKNYIREAKTYSVRIYSKSEINELLEAVGFSFWEIYGDWNGTRHNNSSEDVIIIAYK